MTVSKPLDALILAAGFGSRLRGVEPCKPLTLLHGMSLLEIAIRQLMDAGVMRVVVATGFQAELVETELKAIATRTGVAIEARRVPDFTKPNGHSILAAANALGDRFALVMADHVLSREILRPLVATTLPSQGAVLAIDRRVSSELVDPDDATWVKTDQSGRIIEIGKQIEPYDAVDCGAFLTSSGLLEALETAIAQGKSGSLSDGMQVLADQGRAATIDVGLAWWIDVDEPHALAQARAQIGQHLPHLFGATEKSEANGKNLAMVAQ
ncbi:NTP transferase domain-containing protein [Altererythrobacter sp. GH1-8]|uniref:phosphocholine cytidylyltransferase family protein n=1 Tax=Altererythrobacter sp. GH1-8 TaxID=3349333 RepID=UPI00374DABC9